MPRVSRIRLSLPADEVGAFGEVATSAYARLLQAAATGASSDAGYPPEWYLAEGTIWVIRRSTIECERPIPAGAEVEVSTRVADFRRVRSRREYEVQLPNAPEPCLRAHTDWVYVEVESSKPRRIPSEMMAGFLPDGQPPPLPRAPLEVSPAPAGGAFASRRIVGDADLDALAHVNNARYFDYLEEAALAAQAAAGWPRERIVEAKAILRATRHDIEYLDEARFGEELRCLTWVATVDVDGFERMAEIRRATDDACLTRALSAWRWVDRATGERQALPADFRRILEP